MLLKVKLTPTERDAKAQELAGVCEAIKGLGETRRETVAELNVAIKEKKHILAKLIRHVRDGEEERDVNTTEEIDWATNVAITRRTDTGDVISNRVLTGEERQKRLFPLEANG